MEIYRAITSEEKKRTRQVASFIVIPGLFFIIISSYSLLFDGSDFSSWILFIVGLMSFSFSVYLWNVKKQLTEYGVKHSANEYDAFLGKWYVRYPFCIVAIGMAYLCYRMWLSDHNAPGLFIIIINPITGIMYAAAAIFSAWELSLLLIVLGVICLLEAR